MAHDLVIRSGTVIDGSGGPRYVADVGVDDGIITAIGRIREQGREEIDADNRFVSPGFIDGHTHMDAQFFWDPIGSSSCYHGVTTVVMGNCGFTLAPCRQDDKDLVLRSLERAEDMSRAAMLEGIKWSWESFPEYLDTLDRLPKGINYASYVGHTALRTYVMGERAFSHPATDDDLRRMKELLADSLRAGAVGFSTTRSTTHVTSDDRPVPSRMATWDEVRELVGVMTDLEAGFFELDNEKHEPGAARDEYIDRLGNLAVESGRPMYFMLVVPPNDPEFLTQRLALIEDVAARGGRIRGQVTTHEQLIMRSFETSLPFDKLPGWSAFRNLPLDAQRKGLLDPDIRRSLVDEAVNGDYAASSGVRGSKQNLSSAVAVGQLAASKLRPPNYDQYLVLDSPTGPYRSVGELARSQERLPVEVMIDLALSSGLKQMFGQVLLNSDLDAVLGILRNPRTVVGISDAGAHVSFVCDTSISSRLLASWVREKGEFTWEQGVRMLTSIPAAAYGFADRGNIREGMVADLVVFDPETIAPNLPTVERDFPAGTTRLKQTAIGIDATVVNGEILLRDNVPTGSRPGKLLRGPLHQR